MCGIYGLVSSKPINLLKIISKTNSLRHRGPDGAGLVLFGKQSLPTRPSEFNVWLAKPNPLNKQVVLSHRRLSIIDHQGGSQPMFNTQGELCITFNGEIYNHQSLRLQLQELGYQFVTNHSDTEVVLAAYSQWGHKCLQYLNGMFCFAIFNVREQTLFLARDRLGQKPLYYRHCEHDFEFASESKALEKSSGVDSNSLNYYLKFGYLPEDLSIFKGLKKLAPGHYAILNIQSNKLIISRYWQLPPSNSFVGNDSTEVELLDELQALLFDAVKLRLACDVPNGIFLSGGLDSSLIVAAATAVTTEPVKTFTVTFPDNPGFNESYYAKQIANYFGTVHHELPVPANSLDVMQKIIQMMDEPLADSSLLPTFLVSEAARKHVKVILGGDGGDELFGGCPQYLARLNSIKSFDKVPKSITKLLSIVAAKFPAGIKGRNYFCSLYQGISQADCWGSPYFDRTLRNKLLKLPPPQDQLSAPEEWMAEQIAGKNDYLDSKLRFDVAHYLAEDLLMKVDRASMMNGLEVRNPWLDYRIAEFAFNRVPSSMKIKGQTTRWIQKSLAKRLLPNDYNYQRDQGFCVPLDRWLTTQADNDFLHYLPVNSSHFDDNYIKKLLAGQNKCRSNASRLFSLMLLSQCLS